MRRGIVQTAWSEVMLKLRRVSLLVAAVLVFCEGIEGQNRPESGQEQILFLTNATNGQRVAAVVGQRIEISLATIGPGSYGDQVYRRLRFVSGTWRGPNRQPRRDRRRSISSRGRPKGKRRFEFRTAVGVRFL